MATATKKPTIDELRRQLAELEAEEKQQYAAKRKAYEDKREALINQLAGEAYGLAAQMMSLKTSSVRSLNEFRKEMMEYGELRGGAKNKGSFELKNDEWKIQFASQIIKKFDEKARVAEKHINEFLKSFLKKKDRKTYEFISNLMQRDEESGQFDIDMINRLYTMEEQFDDPNWRLGIKLFKESYTPYGTAQYVRFYQKNEETGAYDSLILDFAKVRPAVPRKEVAI